MSDQGLTCGELVELVTDYLEGRLPAAERARFEAHVAGCPGCERYVEQIRATIGIAGRLAGDGLAPAGRDALLAAFRRWER